jgi:hypothetical protein
LHLPAGSNTRFNLHFRHRQERRQALQRLRRTQALRPTPDRAGHTANANGRDVIAPRDLPITKGLQESIHDARDIDSEIQLQPILQQLAVRPPLDVALAAETETRLPGVVGGLSLALARAFKLMDPKLKNPQTGVVRQPCAVSARAARHAAGSIRTGRRELEAVETGGVDGGVRAGASDVDPVTARCCRCVWLIRPVNYGSDERAGVHADEF